MPDDDDLPSPRKIVYTYFEFAALGCVLDGVTRFGNNDWKKGAILMVVGAVLFFVGRNSGWLHATLSKIGNLFPARKALTIAQEENKNLQSQLSALKTQIEQPMPEGPKMAEELYTIGFDYLPASPLDHGWTQPYYKDGVAVYKTDLDIPGSLRMEITHSVVALNYALPDVAKFADTVQFTSKYAGGSQAMIFTKVEVATRDGSQDRRLWIKYYFGERRAVITPDGPTIDPKRLLPESTVWLPAKLTRDTLRFDIDLRDAVALAVGQQGWIYRSILDFRIRGTLSISPIVFGRSAAMQ